MSQRFEALHVLTLRRPAAVARIRYPRVPPRLPQILTGTEVERMLGCITSAKYRAICSVAYGAGLRTHEACHLKPADIDSARGVIHVREGKGGKERNVMLPGRLLEQLRQYWKICRPAGEWLFPSNRSQGRPVNVRSIRDVLARAVRDARLKRKVTPHLLRHSFATHLLDLGTDLRLIQMLLGHRSFSSTRRYAQLQAEYLKQIKNPLDVIGRPDPRPPPQTPRRPPRSFRRPPHLVPAI